MINRSLRLMSIFLAALVLSSCATLPSIPGNQIGPEIQTGGSIETLYYSPSGPSLDATQEQIISGFLYAGNGPQEDYAVAREYLTASYAAKWNPSTETLIQRGEARIVSNSGTKIRMEVPFDALILEDGTYVSSPGSTRVIEFRLLQVFGKWRISSAPNLTILLRPNFGLLFQPISVYFWDKSLTYLVPEVRWFPTKAAIATKVINALLDGPSTWLEPAVQQIVPKGTKLNINSVTVTNGNALVDLNSTALKVPMRTRPYLRSQILATLSEVSGIVGVTISIERTVQEIASGASGVSDVPSNLPAVLTANGLYRVSGSSTFAIKDTQSPVRELDARGFALSRDESFLVLLAGNAVHAFELDLLGGNNKIVDSRESLLNPTIDPYDQVWTATARLGSEILVIDKAGGTVRLPNPYGFRSTIREIVMSPEGSRLAVLHDYSDGSTVDIFPVIRDKNREVLGLGEPLKLTQFGNSTQAISWVDRVNLAGLVKSKDGAQSMLTVLVGGASTAGRATAEGVSVASSSGGNHFYLDKFGNLNISKTFGWDVALTKVRAIKMAGQ